jgi:hypothetical protein
VYSRSPEQIVWRIKFESYRYLPMSVADSEIDKSKRASVQSESYLGFKLSVHSSRPWGY